MRLCVDLCCNMRNWTISNNVYPIDNNLIINHWAFSSPFKYWLKDKANRHIFVGFRHHFRINKCKVSLLKWLRIHSILRKWKKRMKHISLTIVKDGIWFPLYDLLIMHILVLLSLTWSWKSALFLDLRGRNNFVNSSNLLRQTVSPKTRVKFRNLNK